MAPARSRQQLPRGDGGGAVPARVYGARRADPPRDDRRLIAGRLGAPGLAVDAVAELARRELGVEEHLPGGVEFGEVRQASPADHPVAARQRLRVATAERAERGCAHELARQRGGLGLQVELDQLAARRWLHGRRALVVEYADLISCNAQRVVLEGEL